MNKELMSMVVKQEDKDTIKARIEKNVAELKKVVKK